MRLQQSTPDMRWLESLPRRDCLELAAAETAPRTARRRLARILPEWSLAQFDPVAAVVVSELVTNSMLATRKVQWARDRPPVWLWLLGGPAVLTVLTWDAVASSPVPRVAGADDESGRGLAMVASLSAELGYYPAACGGKVTWAVIDTP